MSDFSILRKSIPRLDAKDKVTGNYLYGMDVDVEGALESVVIRSTQPHARILNIDITQAATAEGVSAIITGKDLSGILMPGSIHDQPLLAYDRVRYHGEPVAILAAENYESALSAASQIIIDYEPLAIVTDAEAAMDRNSPLLHENFEDYVADSRLVRYGNVCCHASLKKGEISKGFEEAHLIVEDVFTTESVHQSHLEPRVAIGMIEPNGKLLVYTNTQLPYWIRTNVAHAIGTSEDNVRIVPTGIGGAFGSKLYPQIEPFVALLARATGRPVRMVTSLEEEMCAGLPRHPSKSYLKTGVSKDGVILARQAKMILDTGAYAGSGPEIASVTILVLAGPYRIEHLQIDSYAVMTNKTNFGAYRGPGGPQANFALESHMDVIASQLGLDPYEFRLRNIVQDGDEIANGQILHGVGLREAMEKAATAIGWSKPENSNKGKGMAIGWWTTTGEKSTSHVCLDSEGNIIVSVGTQEIGTGAIMGGVPQVVAEIMGVQTNDVIIKVVDTSKGLWDWGSQGSRTLFNVGRVAQFACLELITKIKDLASRLLEVEPEMLELKNKMVMVVGSPSEQISFQDLFKIDEKQELQSLVESSPDATNYKSERLSSCLYPAFHYPSFHCHTAEVEVDPGTGLVKVLRYVGAHDIGFAVNPALINGQIQGGVVQGIGMALMEEIIYENGFRTNNNWTDYKLPTIVDVPEIQGIIVEHPIPGGGPQGLKGLGESPVIEPPATIANAIAKATGVRLRSLPMTPEMVLLNISSK